MLTYILTSSAVSFFANIWRRLGPRKTLRGVPCNVCHRSKSMQPFRQRSCLKFEWQRYFENRNDRCRPCAFCRFVAYSLAMSEICLDRPMLVEKDPMVEKWQRFFPDCRKAAVDNLDYTAPHFRARIVFFFTKV